MRDGLILGGEGSINRRFRDGEEGSGERGTGGGLRFFRVVVFFRFDVYLILPIRSLLEILDALPEGAADFRKSPGAEYHKDNDKNDYQFRHAESEHVNLHQSIFGSIALLSQKIKRLSGRAEREFEGARQELTNRTNSQVAGLCKSPRFVVNFAHGRFQTDE